MNKIEQITERIEEIKSEIQSLGDLRPGSISQQYKDPKNQKGGYYQINYMHKMKSRSDYVKKGFVDEMQTQIAEYKKLKLLMEEWIELGLNKSKILMKTNVRQKS